MHALQGMFAFKRTLIFMIGLNICLFLLQEHIIWIIVNLPMEKMPTKFMRYGYCVFICYMKFKPQKKRKSIQAKEMLKFSDIKIFFSIKNKYEFI